MSVDFQRVEDNATEFMDHVLERGGGVRDYVAEFLASRDLSDMEIRCVQEWLTETCGEHTPMIGLNPQTVLHSAMAATFVVGVCLGEELGDA